MSLLFTPSPCGRAGERASRIFVLLLLFLGCFSSVSAQKIAVSGLVMDGTSNEPLPGASVVLLTPKDSVQQVGAITGLEGRFTLPTVRSGRYILRISYVGYQTHYQTLTLTKSEKKPDVGTITLQEDAQLMKEAEVVAKLAQVEMKEDTFVFNADAFRLPEGSALEELVKKLPGAEVDEDGTIKINGKTVSKIMVKGKEFFNNDTKMAMKNLPTKMVKKLKAYDRKSDYTRVTGIDDGEEETVLDLTLQKGAQEGWLLNLDEAGGTESRYSLKANLHRFLDNFQFSVIGSRNNVNDRSFPGGGFRGGWGGGGGIVTSSMAGANFAWENGRPEYSAGLLKIGGNVRWNQTKSTTDTHSNSETFLTSSSSTFSNSQNHSVTHSANVEANFRFEWLPDSLTNILLRPNFSHNQSDNFGRSLQATFNSDPYRAGLSDPLSQYATFADPDSIRVNSNERISFGDSRSNSGDADLQINRQIGRPGRNITLNVGGRYSRSENNSYSRAMVQYYQRSSRTATYQNTTSPSERYNFQGRLSYSEPLFAGANLQFSYQAQRRFQDSDRTMMVYEHLADTLQKYGLSNISAYNLYVGNVSGVDLQNYGVDLTTLVRDIANSQYAKYEEFNQDASLMFRYTLEGLHLNAGVSFQPQETHMKYQKNLLNVDTVRHTQNWAPRIDIRWKISNTSTLRVRYFGSMNQPSMTNLIETMDTSNPLHISVGNAGLQSSWSDRMNVFYNDYIPSLQMGWNLGGWGNINRRTISNATIYDTQTGANYSRPMNINGNWNGGTWMGFNSALGAKKMFNLNFGTNLNHTHSVGYISSNLDSLGRQYLTSGPDGGVDMRALFAHTPLLRATTRSTSIGQNLRVNFRNDWVEVGTNGSYNYQHARSDMQRNANLDTWFFSYGGNFQLTCPWGTAFSTSLTEQCRRGYDDTSMNTNELIWDAQLSQSFLKNKAATISVQWYDILRERSNISRSLSAISRSDTYTRAIHSYVMVHFIYRLNLLGNRDVRGQFGPGGFGEGRGGRGGGFGGGRGGGGNRGGRF